MQISLIASSREFIKKIIGQKTSTVAFSSVFNKGLKLGQHIKVTQRRLSPLDSDRAHYLKAATLVKSATGREFAKAQKYLDENLGRGHVINRKYSTEDFLLIRTRKGTWELNFRGTDPKNVDHILTNAQGLTDIRPTLGYRRGEEIIREFTRKQGPIDHLNGHSMGANLAQMLGHENGIDATGFQGSGRGIPESTNRYHDIRTSLDPVSMIRAFDEEGPGYTRSVLPTEDLATTHDIDTMVKLTHKIGVVPVDPEVDVLRWIWKEREATKRSVEEGLTYNQHVLRENLTAPVKMPTAMIEGQEVIDNRGGAYNLNRNHSLNEWFKQKGPLSDGEYQAITRQTFEEPSRIQMGREVLEKYYQDQVLEAQVAHDGQMAFESAVHPGFRADVIKNGHEIFKSVKANVQAVHAKLNEWKNRARIREKLLSNDRGIREKLLSNDPEDGFVMNLESKRTIGGSYEPPIYVRPPNVVPEPKLVSSIERVDPEQNVTTATKPLTAYEKGQLTKAFNKEHGITSRKGTHVPYQTLTRRAYRSPPPKTQELRLADTLPHTSLMATVPRTSLTATVPRTSLTDNTSGTAIELQDFPRVQLMDRFQSPVRSTPIKPAVSPFDELNNDIQQRTQGMIERLATRQKTPEGKQAMLDRIADLEAAQLKIPPYSYLNQPEAEVEMETFKPSLSERMTSSIVDVEANTGLTLDERESYAQRIRDLTTLLPTADQVDIEMTELPRVTGTIVERNSDPVSLLNQYDERDARLYDSPMGPDPRIARALTQAESIQPSFGDHIRANLSATGLKGHAVGLGQGLIAGIGASYAVDAIDPDRKIPFPIRDVGVGGLAGAGQYAMMRGGIPALERGVAMGGMIKGGIAGMVVGDLSDRGIEYLMDKAGASKGAQTFWGGLGGNVLGGAAAGAMGGGPWGALAGAGLGLAFGLGSFLTGKLMTPDPPEHRQLVF